MSITITDVVARDVRFPTSDSLDGSDAMNESPDLAVQLLAAKFGISVCPHAGGVGLCEYVQHLAIFDYIAVSASLEDRVVEYVDHLHEPFADPATVHDGRYVAPTAPGYSITMRPGSLDRFTFPGGPAWAWPVAQVAHP